MFDYDEEGDNGRPKDWKKRLKKNGPAIRRKLKAKLGKDKEDDKAIKNLIHRLDQFMEE